MNVTFNRELEKLREITNQLIENGYLVDRAAQWESALDAVPDLIFIVNPEYKIEYVNKSLAKRLDTNKIDVLNKDCCYILSVNAGTCLCHKGGSQTDIYLGNELEGWYDFTRSPIFDEKNELLGFIYILRDITKQKELEIELRNGLIKSEVVLEDL